MDYRRELLKGNIQTIILAVLAEQPRHGYGIAGEIERRSEDTLKFGEGTIYPALQALEREGFIQSRYNFERMRDMKYAADDILESTMELRRSRCSGSNCLPARQRWRCWLMAVWKRWKA